MIDNGKLRRSLFSLLAGAIPVMIGYELLLNPFYAQSLDEGLVPAPEEFETSLCVPGQYVMSVAPSRYARLTALDTIQDVADTPVFIAEESRGAILVEETDQRNSVDDDYCGALAKERRALLRESRRSGDPVIVRNYRCACNALDIAAYATTPNDANFWDQWGPHQTNDIDIDAPEAWDIHRGTGNVLIAVVDTGVDHTHPDLSANIWRNPGEIPANGVDDDNNGYVDDYYGYNFVGANSPNTLDDNGHGTHVAGTIAAVTNNSAGVAGMIWNAKIVTAKFLTSTGSGSLWDAVEATEYISVLARAGHRLRVSNNSWGSTSSYGPLYDAMVRVKDAGVLFVAAAGNSAVNTDTQPHYPSSYALDNIISVAALNESGGLAYFSNYGAQSVDIGAPGQRIHSTWPNGGYHSISGTSMAAPHVAGIAALVASYVPMLSSSELRDILLASGDLRNSLTGKVQTGRSLNAHSALILADGYNGKHPGVEPPNSGNPTPSPTPTPTATPSPTPTATPAPTPVAVSGVVRTALGVGIGGFSVELTTSRGARLTAITDSFGRFSFQNVIAPATYEVRYTKPGYSALPTSGSLSSVNDLVTIATARTHNVVFKVVNQQNQPLSGVMVDAGSRGRFATNNTGTVTIEFPHGEGYTASVSDSRYTFAYGVMKSAGVYGRHNRVFVAGDRD